MICKTPVIALRSLSAPLRCMMLGLALTFISISVGDVSAAEEFPGYATGAGAVAPLSWMRADPGDIDEDGDVDLDDFAVLAACLAGPEVTTAPPGCDPVQFAAADIHGTDGDVDLADFSVLQEYAAAGELFLRQATGYPSIEITDGNPASNGHISIPDFWFATSAFPFTVDNPVQINRLAGVFSTNDDDWTDYAPRLQIHSSPEAFAASPINGDVYSTEAVSLADEPEDFGSSFGFQNHYGIFTLDDPVILQPGTYWISLVVARIISTNSWLVSDIDLGTGIVACSDYPDQFFWIDEFSGYGTGTLAIDVIGEFVDD